MAEILHFHSHDGSFPSKLAVTTTGNLHYFCLLLKLVGKMHYAAKKIVQLLKGKVKIVLRSSLGPWKTVLERRKAAATLHVSSSVHSEQLLLSAKSGRGANPELDGHYRQRVNGLPHDKHITGDKGVIHMLSLPASPSSATASLLY